MTTAQLINGVLDREGAEFSDDAVDRGGPTKFGVTLRALAEFRGAPVTVASVKALTRDEAFEVFEHQYLTRSGLVHVVDDGVRVMLLDWAVNSGIGTAVKAVQRIVGVEVDGACGPVTLGALNARPARGLLKDLGHARQTYYARICRADPSQVRFLEGWLSRNWAVSVDPL